MDEGVWNNNAQIEKDMIVDQLLKQTIGSGRIYTKMKLQYKINNMFGTN